ncbi:MAG TPA: hypothetical protein VMU49_01975 [Candidatus Acidoferrales bacterium]|nr:hypothetical protein [Candidatus Acidoferrales bacterium]
MKNPKQRTEGREYEQKPAKNRASRSWQPIGAFTGHESGVGSTAKATKRNKRSL